MYSPKISEDLIPLLHEKAIEENKPMTKIVNEILKEKLTGNNKQETVRDSGFNNVTREENE